MKAFHPKLSQQKRPEDRAIVQLAKTIAGKDKWAINTTAPSFPEGAVAGR
ncbi:MAG: hypothetical protein KA821_01410 [Chitinophagaceae bacterium]|nr:hypothetical protein [Chitinophagaceae bacterium]